MSGSGSGKVWGLTGSITGSPIWVWVWGSGGGVVEVDWEGLGAHDDTTTDHGLRITRLRARSTDGFIVKGLRDG